MNFSSNHFNTSILALLFLLSSISMLLAQTNSKHVKVKGYYKSNDTYVKSHYRTAPNSTNTDNFSTRGNTNYYTGKPGWIAPDNQPTTSARQPSYESTSNYRSSSSYESTTTYNTPDYNRSSPQSTTTYTSSNSPLRSLPSTTTTYSSAVDQASIQYNEGYSYQDRKAIEQILERLGYLPGTIDGVITAQTIEAIKQFQKAHYLTIDGKFGPQCIYALRKHTN
ncbi:MAG: peptidoglycan-binding domain-containing protein [Aureispira sp.]